MCCGVSIVEIRRLMKTKERVISIIGVWEEYNLYYSSHYLIVISSKVCSIGNNNGFM